MAEVAIEVRRLRKAYGTTEAVRGVDFTVGTGEVFALLGPNGAGKTTTVEILEGYRSRDAGDVQVLGYDPARGGRDLKRRIGIVLQQTGVEPYLTVEETVSLFRSYFPDPRPLDEILDVVSLGAQRSKPVRRLSGGQQRRLDVAIGLAGNPELLFLDEPTTGFDPAARRNAWEMVKNLQALGKTVLLTTHYMDEAQYLADRVAIMRRGEIVAEGPPTVLTARDTTTTIRFRLVDAGVATLPAGLDGQADDHGFLRVRTSEPTRVLHELTGWSLRAGVDLEGLTVTQPSLEDVYLELTGSDASEPEVGS